jgi:hypothetical protein
MPINPFIRHGAFGPEATAVLGKAFDDACRDLGELGQFEGLRELIARRIIAAARNGELDPVRLQMIAVSGLSVDSVSATPPLISHMHVHGAAH